ncbi:MAG: SDR family oxidoreductase [Pararhizobium sp.]
MKTALVTGAGRRIGRAIAEDLATHGFAVAIHTNGALEKAEETAEALRDAGAEVAIVSADLTSLTETSTVLAEATRALGPLDLLVNNASIFCEDGAAKFEQEKWDAHFAIHVRAPVILAQHFAAQLPEDTTGLVVNIIDERVWRLTPRFFSYTLSKATLWTATQTLAQGLAPETRVNAIGPGPTLANAYQSEHDFARQIAALPLERGPRLADFGRTVRYLYDTPSITGQMIAIDGGQHLAWQTPDTADKGE